MEDNKKNETSPRWGFQSFMERDSNSFGPSIFWYEYDVSAVCFTANVVMFAGHPLPGVRAYVALMVMDKPAAPTIPESDTDEDEREDEDSDDDLKAEMARNDPPKFVGRADFDLRRYLQQRHDIHTIRLKLQDKRGNDSGEIVCTLQFVLTGVIRLTVLSGKTTT